MSKQNLTLFLVFDAVVLFLIYVFGIAPLTGNSKGTDDSSVIVIESINAGYSPWFDTMWEPQTNLMEVLMFAGQFTLGASVLVFLLFLLRARKSSTCN